MLRQTSEIGWELVGRVSRACDCVREGFSFSGVIAPCIARFSSSLSLVKSAEWKKEPRRSTVVCERQTEKEKRKRKKFLLHFSNPNLDSGWVVAGGTAGAHEHRRRRFLLRNDVGRSGAI